MKRFELILSLATILMLALLIVNPFSEPTSTESALTEFHDRAFEKPVASEGTRENPHARREYEWLLTRNPETGEIPRDIARKELAFAHGLAAQTDLTSLTANEDWVSRGPHNVGGRTRALAIDITDENVILAGAITSGMYRSTDGGDSWTKTTAPNQIHSVSSVAQNQAPGKEHIWYYSTGDRSPTSIVGSGFGFPGTNSFNRGDGIMKSTDGGQTWQALPSTVSGTPDETDPFDYTWVIRTFGDDGVLAATNWGVYRSSDGGASWERTLGMSENERTPPNTEIAIAADGMFYATVAGSGADHGIYRSDDAITWENISPVDWPAKTDRTVIAPAASNANVVYFFTEVSHLQNRLDKFEVGVGWTALTSGLPFNAQISTYGGSLLVLNVKPDDQNTLFLGAINLFRSTDGGQSFEVISGTGPKFHPDQTSITFYPSDPNRMIVGNDGGLYRVADNVAPTVEQNMDWESLNNGYLTTQFYTVAVDHGTPGSEVLLGGTQDNGMQYTTSSDPAAPWQILYGGDGAEAAITDGGEFLYYTPAATFALWRHSFPGGQWQRTNIAPVAGKLGLWKTIFKLDPNDQKVMYLPQWTSLWRNSDLTAIPHVDNGGPTDVNWEQLENVHSNYIHALGISKTNPRRLYYAGADTSAWVDEEVFYIDNPHEGQPVPVNITGENFPFYPWVPPINCIVVDPRDVNKVTVVFPSYGELSIFHTEDAGGTWTPVSGNLEENPDGTGSGPSVRWANMFYLPNDTPVYLAGTSVGLFSTTELDGMNTKWSPEGRTSIGSVLIDHIDVRQSDGFVAVATNGNGVYTTYISQLTTGVSDEGVVPVAFEISSAYPNPFRTSTTVEYELPKAGVVSANVYDIRGRIVESLFTGMRQAGNQTLRWDARNVANGTYFIELRFEGTSSVEKVVVQR